MSQQRTSGGSLVDPSRDFESINQNEIAAGQKTFEQQITINGINFTVNELTKNFPNSYFDTMLSTSFSDCQKTDFKITFPETFDPDHSNGEKYMLQVRDRLDYGYYTLDASMSDPNCFHTLQEFETILDYLLFDESEYQWLEVYDDYDPNENFSWKFDEDTKIRMKYLGPDDLDYSRQELDDYYAPLESDDDSNWSDDY